MKYNVYGVQLNQAIRWAISLDIEVDQVYWANKKIEKMIRISPLLSIGNAQALVQCLNKEKKQWGFFAFSKPVRKAEEMVRFIEVNKDLRYCQTKLKLNLSEGKEELTLLHRKVELPQDRQAISDLHASYQEWKQRILPSLKGKQLLLEEIEETPRVVESEPAFVIQMIQFGSLLGEIQILPGVASPLQSASPVCHRCGSTERVYIQACASCNEPCATCEECIVMGRSKTCTPLIYFDSQETGNRINQSIDLLNRDVAAKSDRLEQLEPKHQLPQELQLTDNQSSIASHALHFVQENQWKELLIWAVTGAGKTEMIFPLILDGLSQNLSILLASPRKDVIKELTPRFRKAFPDVEMVSLYGGSPERWNHGQLYLATTHQVMRFKDFFDIVIIDEMDAFPYHGDPVLHRVVRRALKSDGTGKMIYLTATPSNEWMDQVQQQEIDVAVLPVRYHGKPLPVPELKSTLNLYKLLKQANPPASISEFMENVKKRNGQAFIFVSEVRNVTPWSNRFKKWFSMERIEGVHASDKVRDEKVEQFRRGEIQFLVTTTIMERGVTVPNVHVMVLGADSQVFAESTLVQIAGRVGRSAEFPDGLVWFLAESKTQAMVQAKHHIERMNKKAGL